MKIFIKNFIINLFYFFIINCFLFIGHIWALFGVAFNDTGVHYNTISEAMPTILFGVAPIVLGSIIFIFVFRKKKNFIIYEFLILQLLVIVGWGLFYIVNYVPNSEVNNYINSKIHHSSINKQKKINEQVLKELDNNYLLIDSISSQEQSITLYFNEEKKKLIVEHSINEEKNYNIINSIKKESQEKEKITKYNSDFYFKFDQYDNLSICDKEECYYTYSNCEIKGNSYNYAKYLSIYNSDGKKYNPIQIYRTLVKNSISNNENIYFLNNDRMINIELSDIGIKISSEDKQYINNQNYTWVILKNEEIILQRSFTNYELVFEQDLTKKSFYADIGDYECYLKTFSNELGYIKISNSVYWSNTN